MDDSSMRKLGLITAALMRMNEGQKVVHDHDEVFSIQDQQGNVLITGSLDRLLVNVKERQKNLRKNSD